jgi:hypothetical protein
MAIEQGGNGQGINPDVSEAPTTQPDQAALGKLEQWVKENPQANSERHRKWFQQNSARAGEYHKNWRREHRQWVNERQRRIKRHQKERENWGDPNNFTEADFWKSEPSGEATLPARSGQNQEPETPSDPKREAFERFLSRGPMRPAVFGGHVPPSHERKPQSDHPKS